MLSFTVKEEYRLRWFKNKAVERTSEYRMDKSRPNGGIVKVI
jgi:hypothetical protein